MKWLLVSTCLSMFTPQAVDGDTVKLCGVRIRLVDYDAPELHSRCAFEYRLARLATAELRRLLPTLELTLVDCATNNYGRLCARADGLAAHMISLGYGVAYDGLQRKKDWCHP